MFLNAAAKNTKLACRSQTRADVAAPKRKISSMVLPLPNPGLESFGFRMELRCRLKDHRLSELADYRKN
jgi:hypothetical protein